MKTPFVRWFLVLFVFSLGALPASAAEDVLVVLNGSTETNRETYNFIRKEFRAQGLSYTVAATLNPGAVKAGQNRAVVVLNTGSSNSLDPALKKFIAGYPDKAALFLINLYKGKEAVAVVRFSADTSSDGVDGVTASSAWKEGFGGSAAILEMHKEWLGSLVAFLAKR